MSLKKKIEADILDAMRAKQADRLRTLRDIKSKILLAETEKGAGEMDETREIQLLTKATKQRKESIEIYQQQGRQDLVDKEQAELIVIEEYLPAQLSDDELKEALQTIIQQIGATSMKDMGKVMGMASKSLSGKADGKRISAAVKDLLTA